VVDPSGPAPTPPGRGHPRCDVSADVRPALSSRRRRTRWREPSSNRDPGSVHDRDRLAASTEPRARRVRGRRVRSRRRRVTRRDRGSRAARRLVGGVSEAVGQRDVSRGVLSDVVSEAVGQRDVSRGVLSDVVSEAVGPRDVSRGVLSDVVSQARCSSRCADPRPSVDPGDVGARGSEQDGTVKGGPCAPTARLSGRTPVVTTTASGGPGRRGPIVTGAGRRFRVGARNLLQRRGPVGIDHADDDDERRCRRRLGGRVRRPGVRSRARRPHAGPRSAA